MPKEWNYFWDDPKTSGLLWDDHDVLLSLSWPQVKEKLRSTRGGLGILAADFQELLRYGDEGRHFRRDRFSDYVRDAKDDEDIRILAEILAVMMIRPEVVSLDAAWFITKLDNENSDFDAPRAAKVVNHLHCIHPNAARVLLHALHGFVDARDNRIIPKVIAETGLLCAEAMRILTRFPKAFISYAREDSQVVDKLYSELDQKGVVVWKDDHNLLPGERWKTSIRRAIAEHEFIIVCLSGASVSKRGYFQVEVNEALQKSNEYPADDVCIIPVIVSSVRVERIYGHKTRLDCTSSGF